jgi:hypothetical protein
VLFDGGERNPQATRDLRLVHVLEARENENRPCALGEFVDSHKQDIEGFPSLGDILRGMVEASVDTISKFSMVEAALSPSLSSSVGRDVSGGSEQVPLNTAHGIEQIGSTHQSKEHVLHPVFGIRLAKALPLEEADERWAMDARQVFDLFEIRVVRRLIRLGRHRCSPERRAGIGALRFLQP